jgi:hypothetical protein
MSMRRADYAQLLIRATKCCHGAILLGNTEAATGRLSPYGWGWPTTFSVGRSPVGGGSAGHLEMAESPISKRLLEVISKLCAGNAKSPRELANSRFPEQSSRTVEAVVRPFVPGHVGGEDRGQTADRRHFLPGGRVP